MGGLLVERLEEVSRGHSTADTSWTVYGQTPEDSRNGKD